MFVKVDEPTTIENALDHFDHVARLVGPEHLGVGSDIDLNGYDDMPPALNRQLRAGYKGSYGFREKIDIEGIDHPRRMFDLAEGLIRRKYSEKDIEGILGGNFKRVLSQIWTGQLNVRSQYDFKKRRRATALYQMWMLVCVRKFGHAQEAPGKERLENLNVKFWKALFFLFKTMGCPGWFDLR